MTGAQLADAILAGVGEEATLEDSVILAFKNAMQAQEVPQDKVDAVLAALQANKDKLNAALVANTPAAPTGDGTTNG